MEQWTGQPRPLHWWSWHANQASAECAKSFRVEAAWECCVWHNYQQKSLRKVGLELWQRLNRVWTFEEVRTLHTGDWAAWQKKWTLHAFKDQRPGQLPWSSRCILGYRVHAGKQDARLVRLHGITAYRLCNQTTWVWFLVLKTFGSKVRKAPNISKHGFIDAKRGIITSWQLALNI